MLVSQNYIKLNTTHLIKPINAETLYFIEVYACHNPYMHLCLG